MSDLGTVVVAGGSLAGLRAVEALRRRGFDGRIAWIGGEQHLPYDRPPLSKQVLAGSWDAERIALRKQPLSELGAELYFGRRATALDIAAHEIVLDGSERVSFDGLVIATGARPRTLGSPPELAGVHTLRTLEDALTIRDLLERNPRVLIVGAGFIGLEVAAVCRKRSLPVTVVDTLSSPLNRTLGTAAGQLVERIHRDEGVTFIFDRGVRELVGGTGVEQAILSDGTQLTADLVIVGIGVVPETDWLTSSGIRLANGVVCDSSCATNIPGVVAAGDVARWENPLFGASMRVEHWTNAVEQANAAVDRLLDGPAHAKPFAPAPYFWSDQYNVKLQFVGHYSSTDRVHVLENDTAARRVVLVYESAGRITGALTSNRPAALAKYRALIAAQTPIEAALSGHTSP
ncbi:MAG TPA: FAD-dependent oxidoreductase [Polyangiaceae bacterium]|nr:FAD-dependent oxidoreductase [Polyangiaceae bacterium]